MGLDEALDQLANEAHKPCAGDPDARGAGKPLQKALDELVGDATQLAIARELLARREQAAGEPGRLLRGPRRVTSTGSVANTDTPAAPPLDAALDELAHQAFAAQPGDADKP